MSESNKNKKCLLVFPRTFYSYSKEFKEAFQSLGYHVIMCNDEYPDSVWGKIMGKLHIPLLLPITKKVITQRFLKDETFDLVIIMKGRGMSVSLLERLNQISPRTIGYNFDSFRFHKAPLHWLKYASKYCTFDYRDAEDHKLSLVELFSSMPERVKPDICKYEISAILKNHSKRLQFIDKVLMNIPSEKKFIYIFESNKLNFIINFIKNPLLYLKYMKYISFKSLPYDTYSDVLYNSNFTIDFAHPLQTGITIRCFEALSAQTKIITNNSFVTRNSHFNETNAIVFDKSSDPVALKEHYNKIYNVRPPRHKRTIYDFINELIS